MRSVALLTALLLVAPAAHGFEVDESKIKTPKQALEALKAGNERFVSGKPLNQDYRKQIEKTSGGQQPYATILSCLDSRVPPEILFDQGIGDLFVGRVAGNIEDIHMLGSFEFAKQVVGTKLLVVLGHTSCGAVIGACQNVKLDNLTHLLSEIRPAVATVEAAHPGKDVCAKPLVDEVAAENVRRTIRDIREKSQVIVDLEKQGKLMVVGAMYDIGTGKVTFL
jgi:carbonic anhydrase